MRLAPGIRLGTYEVVAPLGAGGMGEVYRAHDSNLRRDVAIKVLPASVAAEPERIARFEREARAVAALTHPNILAIHDFGHHGEVYYAVTELLEGETLRDRVERGPSTPAVAASLACQIARGLEAAHARGIVHRDLKPENVFVLQHEHVKILDFGLATADGADTTETSLRVTAAGTVLGTAGYMSPEQVRGERADHRSDIFSLGCVLYELLAGQAAFRGDSSVDILHATLHANPDFAALDRVPTALVRIVERCVQKEPGQRFQSAADVRFALQTLVDEHSAEAIPQRLPRRAATSVAWVSVTLAALAILVTALVWSMRSSRAGTAASGSAVATARGIAVLPFDNLGDAGDAYFAAGVTEEVTLQIAKISALRVMSRNAVARFKTPAAQLPEMTRELNIGAVLAGSVRHAESQVRVSVELLAAPSGEVIWSEQYERTMSNIFDVQSDIAFRVARALQASLAPEERSRIERLPTNNPTAYEVYLKQRPLNMGMPAQNAEALRLLDTAIELDPKFALAHAMRARRLTFSGDINGRGDYARAIESAQTALMLDPQLSRAHYSLGLAFNRVGRNDDARLAMQRAIELDSNNYLAMQDLAILEVNTGRLDQAVYWARRSVPLAPNLAATHYTLALPLVVLDDQAAERYLEVASRRFPASESTGGHYLQSLLAVIELRRGNASAGLVRMRGVETANPGNEGVTTLTNELATYADAPDAAQRLDTTVRTSPTRHGWWAPYTPRTLRAYLFVHAGQPERARPLIDAALADIRKAAEDGDRSHLGPYEESALQLMLGNREAALELFEKAIAAGAIESKFPTIDPLLAGLHRESRFQTALARLEKTLTEMRQRVDFTGLEDLVPRGQ